MIQALPDLVGQVGVPGAVFFLAGAGYFALQTVKRLKNEDQKVSLNGESLHILKAIELSAREHTQRLTALDQTAIRQTAILDALVQAHREHIATESEWRKEARGLVSVLGEEIRRHHE